MNVKDFKEGQKKIGGFFAENTQEYMFKTWYLLQALLSAQKLPVQR